MTSSRQLFLIRHGRVDFESSRFRLSPRGRQWDPPLGDAGREQALRLAARLSLLDPAPALFSSPFTRCRQTIAPYEESSALRAEVDEEVGEVFMGEWEGLSFEQIVTGDEEMARRYREQEAMFSFAPGGETGARLRARVVPAIERMLEASGDRDVAVVSHGGVINAYVNHVLGLDQDMVFGPDNTSINTIWIEDDGPRIRFLNDVRHLTEPAVFAPLSTPDEG